MATSAARGPIDPTVATTAVPTGVAVQKRDPSPSKIRIPNIDPEVLQLFNGKSRADFAKYAGNVTYPDTVEGCVALIKELAAKGFQCTLERDIFLEQILEDADLQVAKAKYHNTSAAQRSPTKEKSPSELRQAKAVWLFNQAFPKEQFDLFRKLPRVEEDHASYPAVTDDPNAIIAALDAKITNWTNPRKKLAEQMTVAKVDTTTRLDSLKRRQEDVETIWKDRENLDTMIDDVNMPFFNMFRLHAQMRQFEVKVTQSSPTADKEKIANLLTEANKLRTQFVELKEKIDNQQRLKLEGERLKKQASTSNFRIEFNTKLNDCLFRIRTRHLQLLVEDSIAAVEAKNSEMDKAVKELSDSVAAELTPPLKPTLEEGEVEVLSRKLNGKENAQAFETQLKKLLEKWNTHSTSVTTLLQLFDKNRSIAQWSADDKVYMQDDRNFNRKLSALYQSAQTDLTKQHAALQAKWLISYKALHQLTADLDCISHAIQNKGFVDISSANQAKIPVVYRGWLSVDTRLNKMEAILKKSTDLATKIAASKETATSATVPELQEEAKKLKEEFLTLQAELASLPSEKLVGEWKTKYDRIGTLRAELIAQQHHIVIQIRAIQGSLLLKELVAPVEQTANEMTQAIAPLQILVAAEIPKPLKTTLSQEEIDKLSLQLGPHPENPSSFDTSYLPLAAKWREANKGFPTLLQVFEKWSEHSKWLAADKEYLFDGSVPSKLTEQYTQIQTALTKQQSELQAKWQENDKNINMLAFDMDQILQAIRSRGFSTAMQFLPSTAAYYGKWCTHYRQMLTHPPKEIKAVTQA